MRKVIKIGLILLGVVLAMMAVAVMVDYKKFSGYQPSSFFGSKDTYDQEQSLYFDNIKVTVSEVEHKENSPKKTSAECNAMEANGVEKKPLTGNIYNDYFNTEAGLRSGVEICRESAARYENFKQVTVHYFVENMDGKPLDISAYRMSLEGSNELKDTKPAGLPKTLLANQSKYANISTQVFRDFDENFALVVTHNGQQKQINLSLPKIEPSS